MSFYNRLAAQLVRPFVNGVGSVEPLDVVSYGGRFRASAAVNNNSSATILAAAPTGQLYRLHRYGISIGEGLAAYSTILMALSDAAGEVDADLRVFPAATTIIGASVPLMGLLSAGPVTGFQFSSGTVTMYLAYDVVLTPNLI